MTHMTTSTLLLLAFFLLNGLSVSALIAALDSAFSGWVRVALCVNGALGIAIMFVIGLTS
jgi:hypothetical protein